jgi:carboxyl-terminal processing protease
MSSSIRRTVLLLGALFICLCLSFVAGLAVSLQLNAHRNPAHGFEVFWEAWDHVDEHFYGELPSDSRRTYGAIQEALQLLDDPHTVFIEPQPRELERDRMRGTFGGVGTAVWRDSEGQMVLSPHPNSPAEAAGIRVGDILLAVDGNAIGESTTIDDVRAQFHGEVDTPVTLTISRPPTPPFDITVIRAQISVPSVTWRVLDQALDIGYIHIESFTEKTSDEASDALQELLYTEAVAGLILDLRNNSGGLLNPTVATASKFLREGNVLVELDRNGRERIFSVQDGGVATDVPLAVLVNGGTASAAEILAGALQDHDRGTLIGEPTFGKGSVQLIYDLSDGSSLHVTSAVWLTPERHRIEGQGLTPDIHIPRGDGLEDKQLNGAVGYLQSHRRDTEKPQESVFDEHQTP